VIPPDPAVREKGLRDAFIPWLAFVDPDTGQRKRRVAKWHELPTGSRALIERLQALRLATKGGPPALPGRQQKFDV
jgi:hypothetical protein